MTRLLTMSILLLHPLLSSAQDSNFARLELDVRQLQREVLILSQLVNQLRTRVDTPAPSGAPPSLAPVPDAGAITQPGSHTGDNPRWVDADRWRKLRTGMSELEVISELGPPTSTRAEETGVVLLYALELGTASFLAGSVRIRDHAVIAIETPALK